MNQKFNEAPLMRPKTLTVVIPALNEEASIAQVVRQVPLAELARQGYEGRVLVVDNGSDDKTGELARQAGAQVVVEPRRGYGYAYLAGFTHADGDIIATADADLTYPMEDIPHLVEVLDAEGLDFITTNRMAHLSPEAMRPVNRMGNSFLSLVARLLFGIRLQDSQSGMWLFRRHIIPHLQLKSSGMALSQELKIKAYYLNPHRWKEVPITYRPRVGKVKLRVWRDGVINLAQLFQMRFSRLPRVSTGETARPQV